jgi:EspG family
MTAALAPQLTLTDDQLRVAASRVGVYDLPTVLLSRPRYSTVDRREAAFDRAARELLSRNLIIDGSVHPELAIVLQALQRPDRELAMRVVTPDGTARISVVRRGTLCVLARRIGDEILLRIIGHSIELPDAAAALLAELPQGRPADIQAIGAPLCEMVECLTGTHDAVDLADRIRTLGAEQHAALLLGTTLASRQAFAEVVYFALAHGEDRISRGPAAVALFYTKRGRVIGAPSASPTGELWTTLKAGSDHAFAQAIGQLVGLAEEGWAILGGSAL